LQIIIVKQLEGIQIKRLKNVSLTINEAKVCLRNRKRQKVRESKRKNERKLRERMEKRNNGRERERVR